MIPRTVLLGVLALFTGFAQAQQEIPLWQEGAPSGIKHDRPEVSEDKRETGRLDRWISYVSHPTLTVYPADPGTATGAAMLVIPGGGFRYVCIDKEGIEVAQWLNSLGITAAVLKYRVLDPDGPRNAKTVATVFPDASRAMRVLRARAADLAIDPQRIGVIGFSAGAIMAIDLVTGSSDGDANSADPIARTSDRPSAVVCVYGGVPPGKLPPATQDTPPFFIAHAADDPKAPASVAIKVFQHLREGGASAELHIFHKGDHGFGVMPATGSVRGWTSACAAWLRDQKFLRE